MYTVLNSDFQVKGSLTLNNGRGSTAFFADTITQQIATDDSNNPDTLLSNSFNDYDKQGNTKQWNHTLTLNVEATTLGTSITTSDYIMYFDEVAKKYYMMKVIDTATDRNSGFITVDCINTAIYELGKQLVVEEKTFQNAALSQVVESVYKNAPFSVVIQDDLTISIDYTISANTSLQAVVQDLQTKYNVDVDSWITLDNDGQIGERVLYFGHLGSDNGELIRYGGGKGFENINAQELSDIIYTKVYVTGVTSDTDTTKGHIGSVNNGLEYIVDDDANQRMYAVGASQQQPVYLEGQLTNNILSEPSALLDWGKQQLALFNHPRFNYTVTPLHDEVVGIGDSITVQDFHIQPMILVTSKVIQKSTSFASPETNTFVLGEFSSIFSDRTSKNNMVIEVIKKDVTVVQEAADYAKAQADEAHRQAVAAQKQAIHAQTSADGKTTTYTVDDFQDLPSNAVEGDLGWVKTSDGTVMYIYTKKADGTFAWIENVNPHTKEDIANAVDTSVKTAKQYTDDAIKTNNTDISNTINEVSQEKIDATLADANFNAKAQAMADKALADAKANTATVAQDTLNSANQNIAAAKSDLTNSIASEASARSQAVASANSQAQTYVNQAKADAMSAASSADGVIRTAISSSADSLSATITQNKSSADSGISTAQTTAKAAVDGLALKVSKTDYDQKTGDLSTKINDVKQTADSSAQTIADIQEADDKQDARMSEIENTASGLKSTVSDLKTAQGKQSGDISTLQQRADGFDATVTKVDNLSTGDRNYILDTANQKTQTSNGKDNQDFYNQAIFYSPIKNWGVSNGDYVISFDWTLKTALYSDMQATVFFNQSPWQPQNFTVKSGQLKGHVDLKFKLFPGILTASQDVTSLNFRIMSQMASGNTITYSNLFMKSGTISTTWTPAPEDLSSATARAQLTADNAALNLSNYKIDADGRISKAQSGVEANANAITQKVSQTDYDKKTGDLTTAVNTAQSTANSAVTTIGDYKTSNDQRVKAAESAISQNANDITLKVAKTDYDQKTGELSGQISTINQTAGEISQTVSDVKAQVNNLSVGGGVNLLQGTGTASGDVSEGGGIFAKGAFNGYDAVKTNGAWQERLINLNSALGRTNAKAGDWFTISVFVKADKQIDTGFLDVYRALGNVDANTNDGHINPIQMLDKPITTQWQQYTWSFQINNISLQRQGTRVEYNSDTSDNWIYWAGWVLEKGIVAHDWSPAPKDTDNKISTVSQTVDGISSIVSDPTTGLTKRVQTAEGTLSQVTGADIPNLQKATYWQPYGSLDFNSYTKQGSFFFNTTASKTNGPTSSNGWIYLMVDQGTSDNTRIKQTAWYDGVDGVKITYVRTLNSGTWSPWYANDNDSVTTISQTNSDIKQEIKDRADGDTNTLTQAKDFTTSSITSSETGMKSLITQTSDAILGKVGAVNLFPNSEFEKDYGYRDKSGNVTLSLGVKNNVDGRLNGTVEVISTAAYYQGYWGRNIPVYGGQSYSISTFVHYTNGGLSNGSAVLDVWFIDKDGNRISQGTIGIGGSNNNSTGQVSSPWWVKLYIENLIAPTNAVYMQVSLVVNGEGAGQYAMFTQPMVTATEKLQTYTPNNDITTQLALLKDNWSIGINDNIGNITSGIVANLDSMSLISKNIVLDGNTTVTGDFYALGGNFKNLNASNVTFGTLNGNQVNITNVNVSNLVGDTITGFNFNINKSMFIAPGGTITSGVMSMTNDGFSIVSQAGGFTVTANNIAASRQSPQGYKVTGYGTYHINSQLGLSGGDGTIQVFNPGDTSGTPYKTGSFHSEYGLNNLLIKTNNYSNGDLDEYLNISSASFDLYNMDKNSNITRSIGLRGGVGLFSDSVTVPTVYNDTNLWLKSNNNSVILQGGGVSSLQARENGYLYYLTLKKGSGGSSLQVAGDGAFFIQTSATKYKEDIQYDGGTSVGDRFLTLDPATWQDKGEYEQRKLYRENGTSPDRTINMDDKRYYGLIAEDLVKAGLEEFVVRDEVTGEVNGLEYDKVAISLIPVVREQRNALNELRVEIERLKDKING